MDLLIGTKLAIYLRVVSITIFFIERRCLDERLCILCRILKDTIKKPKKHCVTGWDRKLGYPVIGITEKPNYI
jgi:hypothetical protein